MTPQRRSYHWHMQHTLMSHPKCLQLYHQDRDCRPSFPQLNSSLEHTSNTKKPQGRHMFPLRKESRSCWLGLMKNSLPCMACRRTPISLRNTKNSAENDDKN